MRLLSSLCVSIALFLAAPSWAATPRFDSLYLYQSEAILVQKQIDFKDMARFSRDMQNAVWKAIKKADIPSTNGYIILAVRSDGQVMAWLDMQPGLHEYYDYEIVEAVRKVPAFKVSKGIAVFAIKMAIESPKHTTKPDPDPIAWKDAKKKFVVPNQIEGLVLSLWPEE